MIADDDADNRAFLDFLFKRNKAFEVLGCVSSAIEAAKFIVINKASPDVLLLDIFMPLKNSSVLLSQLQKQHLAPKMCTFIISALLWHADFLKSKGPAVKFIVKPLLLKEFQRLPALILERVPYAEKTAVQKALP